MMYFIMAIGIAYIIIRPIIRAFINKCETPIIFLAGKLEYQNNAA